MVTGFQGGAGLKTVTDVQAELKLGSSNRRNRLKNSFFRHG